MKTNNFAKPNGMWTVQRVREQVSQNPVVLLTSISFVSWGWLCLCKTCRCANDQNMFGSSQTNKSQTRKVPERLTKIYVGHLENTVEMRKLPKILLAHLNCIFDVPNVNLCQSFWDFARLIISDICLFGGSQQYFGHLRFCASWTRFPGAPQNALRRSVFFCCFWELPPT